MTETAKIHRKDHLANSPIRLIDGSFGDVKEQVGFACDLFDIFDEGFLHAPFCLLAQMMSHINEQINQGIHNLLPSSPTIGSEQGQAQSIRMAADLVQFFDRDAIAIAVQCLGGDVSKQISRQAKLMKTLQFLCFPHDAL
jgi:hypothetical protein